MYPPGMIGIPCSDSLRTSDILSSIMGLQRPTGTVFKKQNGLGVAHPLNLIGQAFMDRPNLSWLFLTNDDNLLPPNTLIRLLDRMYSPTPIYAVTGLYFGRIQPFEPIAFDRIELRQRDDGQKERWYHRHLMQPGENGIIPIVACGDGCLLVNRTVMERIGYPWWSYGETLPDACDHDMVFSRRIRDAGFQIWLDTGVRVDHVCQMVVRPHRDPDGQWRVHLVQGDNPSRIIDLPAAFKNE